MLAESPYEYELGNYELPTQFFFFTKAKELMERFSLTAIGLRRYSPDDLCKRARNHGKWWDQRENPLEIGKRVLNA